MNGFGDRGLGFSVRYVPYFQHDNKPASYREGLPHAQPFTQIQCLYLAEQTSSISQMKKLRRGSMK